MLGFRVGVLNGDSLIGSRVWVLGFSVGVFSVGVIKGDTRSFTGELTPFFWKRSIQKLLKPSWLITE